MLVSGKRDIKYTSDVTGASEHLCGHRHEKGEEEEDEFSTVS